MKHASQLEGCNVINTAQGHVTSHRKSRLQREEWPLQFAELDEVRLLQSDSPHSAAGCRKVTKVGLHLAGEKPSPQVSELKGVVWLQENREDCERAAGQ